MPKNGYVSITIPQFLYEQLQKLSKSYNLSIPKLISLMVIYFEKSRYYYKNSKKIKKLAKRIDEIYEEILHNSKFNSS